MTEVIGVFELEGGNEIEFKRTFEEKWETPKGESEAIFTGNKGKRYINGVEVGEKEYDNKVIEVTSDAIIVGTGKKATGISVLKLISNAKYFNEILHWAERKQILFDIVPPISDEDIINSEPELKGLEEILEIGIDTYTAQETPKIKKIKEELNAIPSRIEENQRNMPQVLDFVFLEKEKADYENEYESINKSYADMSAVFEEHKRKQQEIFNIEKKVSEIDNKKTIDEQKDINEKNLKIQSLKNELTECEQYQSSSISSLESNEKKCLELERMLDEKRKVHAELKSKEYISPSSEHFICPTCKRPLKVEDIEKQIEEMRINFNTDHARKVEASKQDGIDLKNEIASKKKLIGNLESKITFGNKRIEECKEKILEAELSVSETIPFDNTERDRLTERIHTMKAILVEPQTNKDELLQRQSELKVKIDEINQKLYTRQQIDKIESRTNELKERERMLANKKADIEKMLYKCQLFTRLKVSMLEDNLSSLFKHTKIKLIDISEKNGKVVENECCIATYNGINYRDVNTAGKAIINLDIANVISKAFGFKAPVIFDNREGVNELIPTELQTVNLFVTQDDEKLRVEVL